MKKSLIIGASALSLLLVSPFTSAHRVWIKPSTTVVSGENEWITFDAAIANGIFAPDHFAMPLERLNAFSPDGKNIELKNPHKLHYRSVFDLELTQEGTYKVASSSRSISARWEDEKGERHFWPGRGEVASPAEFEAAVPKDAKNLEVVDSARRVEVYVTSGAPSDTVLKPTNKGLELVATTHPNDLYVNENVEFRFIMDGESAAATQVTVVKEGEKYRDTANPIEVKADAQGKISLQFPDPGMYWLEAEYEDNKAKAPAKTRRGTYVVVLEVLPM
ncbi:DUF4198 domain-containing protein [Alteromonas pelagimontana]|uniref:DUF4198 domain-containing protein n=1 Tax=Alteromonas pelagimontana TaxID=1858656 RepID=A0A6M4MBW6_9ALTE|nr:DUF4198 domain-containing protein [Alteromonas pelagimontana]QJR80694.1 DUF4198 domain-containing protein [Alteromonas pelagimontana]